MSDSLSGAIIAAGRGDRLRPAVAGVPKPLVALGGRTLLERQIELMRGAGLRPIHVIINSETATLAAARQLRLPSVVDLIIADTPSSMESLLKLGERMAPGGFVLATVDAIFSVREFSEFVRVAGMTIAADAGGWNGLLGITRWRGDDKPLFVSRGAGDAITGFGVNRDGWVTAGVYAFQTGIFEAADVARRRGLDALRKFLGLLLERGARLKSHELQHVLDLDSAEELAAARAWLETDGSGELK